MKERLQKIMAAAGIASRRECENIIAQGRVEVDGEVVTRPGTLVDAETQDIVCDGTRLRPEKKVYFLLNKPRGVICSLRGAADKPKAVDYVPEKAAHLRIYTIGRLDVDSEGAIILTNDGDLTHLVTHPRFEVEKIYRVEVKGDVEEETLAKMRKGVWLAEGRTGPVQIKVLKRMRGTTVLEMKLKEGKKREVRRLVARFGHEAKRLVRTNIGPIELGRLPRGRTRALTAEEVKALRDSAKAVVRLGGGSASRARTRSSGSRKKKPPRRP